MQAEPVRADLDFGILANFDRGTSASPSARAIGKAKSQPPSSVITISPRRESKRAARAIGARANAAAPRAFAA